LLAAVDVVTKEEVVGLWREAAILEQTQQVIVLPMDIAANLQMRSDCGHHEEILRFETYLDGSLQLEQNRLRDEDLASFGAKVTNLGLKELNLLTGTTATDLEEPVDYGVEVDFMLVCHLVGLSQRKRA
jgi:hypothetical protein